jgi:hypothetical protein
VNADLLHYDDLLPVTVTSYADYNKCDQVYVRSRFSLIGI